MACRGAAALSQALSRGERGSPSAGKGKLSAGGLGRGARVALAEEARGRGGARPRVGRNLDGRMHLMGGVVG